MTRTQLLLWLALPAWLAIALVILRLGDTPGYTESCPLEGPWGCLPPPAALAALHAFWLMVLAPLVAWTILNLDRQRLKCVGAIACTVGLVGLLALLGWAIATGQDWYGELTAWLVGFRLFFLIATSTQLPVVQCVLVGLVLWVSSRMKRVGDPRSPTIARGEG